MPTKDQLRSQLIAINDNLDSLKYAAPEMQEFFLNEIRENAKIEDDDEEMTDGDYIRQVITNFKSAIPTVSLVAPEIEDHIERLEHIAKRLDEHDMEEG